MARFTFLLPDVTLNGGVRVVAQYCAELIAQGHHVQIVARTPALPYWRDVLRQGWTALRRPPMRLDFFEGMLDRLTIVPSWRNLRAGDLPDADFLILTWWETVEWARNMPADKGVQVHLMQHYEMFPYFDPARVAATYEVPMIRVAVSQWIADQVAQHHGQPTQAVIANAVDTDHFTFVPERHNEVLTLGFLYSSPAFKNPALVFALKQHLADQGITARFVCLSAEADVGAVLAQPDITLHHRPP